MQRVGLLHIAIAFGTVTLSHGLCSPPNEPGELYISIDGGQSYPMTLEAQGPVYDTWDTGWEEIDEYTFHSTQHPALRYGILNIFLPALIPRIPLETPYIS